MNRGVNHRLVRGIPVRNRLPAHPLGSAMFSEHAWELIARSLKLSGRELELVRGVFDDETEPAIAARLGISQHTVHTHFERLHHKLAVADRTQMLTRVMREFLALTASLDNDLPPICPNRLAGVCPLQPSPRKALPPLVHRVSPK